MIYHAKLPEVGHQLYDLFIGVLSSWLYLVVVSFQSTFSTFLKDREGKEKADF